MRWFVGVSSRIWAFFFRSLIGDVVSFRLLNGRTGNPIVETIMNNSIIDVSTLSTRNIELHVITEGDRIGSLRFDHNNDMNYMIDNTRPYKLCEDTENQRVTCDILIPGKHTLVVTPYDGEDATGWKGTSVTISFTIRDGSDVDPPAPVPTPIRPRPPPTTKVAPVPVPTKLRQPVSATSPRPVLSERSCRIPKFDVNDWEDFFPKHPVSIAESQGVLIDHELVTVGGFINVFASATNQTYVRDITKPTGVWRRMDDIPLKAGITHAAFVLVGKKIYMCGGYLGGHPGPHSPFCFVYDHSIAVGSGQWSKFDDLPSSGTAGGGMVYDSTKNTLYYAAGGQRNTPGKPDADDMQLTWKYSLDDRNSGWVETTSIPYAANHISFVTGIDEKGKERHYFFGGQKSENETLGNLDNNYEWNANNERWIARARIPFARGHAASSTIPISCGFVIAGGSVNNYNSTGKLRTVDISYYDIPTNTWTSIGSVPIAVNTPIARVGEDGYMYFLYRNVVSKRRKIII